MKHRIHASAERAVTLTELLVVIVIISLLATIAIPVYLNKAEQARIATARSEVRQLAEAEDACAIVHQFYVPLQMLDDTIYDPVTHDTNLPGRSDDLNNEPGSIRMIYATRPVSEQRGFQASLQDRSNSFSQHQVAVTNLYEKWAGPFLTANRVAFGEELKRGTITDSMAVQYDFPLDPWGSPYRFYSAIGLIGSGAETEYHPGGTSVGSASSFSDGTLTSTDDRFDRFAIASWGPDGRTSYHEAGADRDDIYYLFGGNYTESSFRAFY